MKVNRLRSLVALFGFREFVVFSVIAMITIGIYMHTDLGWALIAGGILTAVAYIGVRHELV